MNDEFYNRIIYKKNAFVDLKEYLLCNYTGKKVLLISSKSVANNHLTEIMNCISLSSCSFKYFISKNNFSNKELQDLSEITTKTRYDLIVVFGSLRALMVTKYFANIFDIPYIVCPSGVSNTSFFSNICVNPYDSTRSFYCDYPDKIFISESVIKTEPRKLVKQAVFYIMSTNEILAVSNIDNMLFNHKQDVDNIQKLIDKLKIELRGIMSGDVDEKLILTDIMIDLAYNLDKIDILKSSLFNLCCLSNKLFLESNSFVGIGEMCLLASKTLLLCYKNLFSLKKIKQLEIPNFVKIVENVNKYNISYKKINDINYFNDILLKKELFLRINNLKEEFLYQCNKRIEEQNEMLKLIKKYDSIFTYTPPKIKDIFTAVKVLPYISYNNFIVELMGSIGILNSL